MSYIHTYFINVTNTYNSYKASLQVSHREKKKETVYKNV